MPIASALATAGFQYTRSKKSSCTSIHDTIFSARLLQNLTEGNVCAEAWILNLQSVEVWAQIVSELRIALCNICFDQQIQITTIDRCLIFTVCQPASIPLRTDNERIVTNNLARPRKC